jgi:hypothetical protein
MLTDKPDESQGADAAHKAYAAFVAYHDALLQGLRAAGHELEPFATGLPKMLSLGDVAVP